MVLKQVQSYACIITVGGTGISKREITIDTLQPLLNRELNGLMEAARAFEQRRTPYAAMSRDVTGFIDRCCPVAVVVPVNPWQQSYLHWYISLMFAVTYHIPEAMNELRTWKSD